MAQLARAVFARQRQSPAAILVNAATADGLRFDLVVHRSADLERGLDGPAVVLHDRNGRPDRVRCAERRLPGPEQVLAAVEEFLRSLLLLSVVGPREE